MQLEILNEVYGGLKFLGECLRPNFTYSASNRAKIGHIYTITHEEYETSGGKGTRIDFLRAVQNTHDIDKNSPELTSGMKIKMIGEDRHGYPIFEAENGEDHRPIYTNWRAKGPLKHAGLKLSSD